MTDDFLAKIYCSNEECNELANVTIGFMNVNLSFCKSCANAYNAHHDARELMANEKGAKDQLAQVINDINSVGNRPVASPQSMQWTQRTEWWIKGRNETIGDLKQKLEAYKETLK